MKYEITEENNIILSGLQFLQRKFDSLSEYVVFSVIQTMTQARRGQYDGNINFIAQWSMLSDIQARRVVHNLIKKGYIEAEYRAGNTTILRAVPLSKCEPYQNDSPITGDKTPLSFGTPFPPIPPIPKESSLNNYYSSRSACAQGIGKLKEYINNSDLREWGERKIYEYHSSKTLEDYIQEFYDNDFTVREKIERSARTEVLKHFQNWLPRYIQKQQEQLKQQDNGSKSREDSVRKVNDRFAIDRSYANI